MLHVVQNTKFRFCYWGLEIIGPTAPSFRIPSKGKDGKFEWKGCYCSPNCAMAALKMKSDCAKLVPEKHAELVEAMQATLHRNDKGKLTYDQNPKLVITIAPNPKAVVRAFEQGGTLSSDEFHKTFDPQYLFCTVFDQVIPSTEEPGSSDDEGHATSVGSSVTGWKLVRITRRARNQKGVDDASAFAVKAAAPRNLAAVIDWLVEKSNASTSAPSEEKTPFVVYPHSDTDKTFAIGSPNDWLPENLPLNTAATKILGENVYGDVCFVTKNMLKIRKSKKPTKKPASIPDPDLLTDSLPSSDEHPDKVPEPKKRKKHSSGKKEASTKEDKREIKRSQTPSSSTVTEKNP